MGFEDYGQYRPGGSSVSDSKSTGQARSWLKRLNLGQTPSWQWRSAFPAGTTKKYQLHVLLFQALQQQQIQSKVPGVIEAAPVVREMDSHGLECGAGRLIS
jgi:hypothetical protein